MRIHGDSGEWLASTILDTALSFEVEQTATGILAAIASSAEGGGVDQIGVCQAQRTRHALKEKPGLWLWQRSSRSLPGAR